jgi:phosphoribosylformimino-5-aminoimidazole carboxamide ribotide isomerase
MILFPAIDIRGGKCVRLTEGRFDKETIFADNPIDMAMRWENEGAQYLHLVDLDGALAGKPMNLEVIATIAKTVAIPVQLGGGIRNLDTIAQILEVGVQRVILGSIAVRQPELVEAACKEYGDRIVVGIDARDGLAAVEGWGVAGGIGAEELAKKMAQVGVARIIYTDISRDGTLSGVNVSATAALAKVSGIPIIASGGVRDLADIEAIKKAAGDGIEGVIVGKAIYTGSLCLADALKMLQGE